LQLACWFNWSPVAIAAAFAFLFAIRRDLLLPLSVCIAHQQMCHPERSGSRQRTAQSKDLRLLLLVLFLVCHPAGFCFRLCSRLLFLTLSEAEGEDSASRRH
jgi:hypothetical protein